jgi:hypothetical protein
MSFDWMAFAEGFMETAAANIKDKKREAREYETEQEDLAKRNVLKISQRNATVNKIMGVATMLKDNGVSDQQIQAAIASGPNAIVELSTKVQEAVAAGGGKPLTSADVDSIIRMPKDFSPVDMDLDEYVKRSYGLYSPNVGVGEEAEVGFWDRVSGDAAMKRAKAKLDSSAMYEGMTAADINELAALSDYQAVIPSTFATFTDFKRFDNKARVSVQADLITQIEALEEMDSEYAAARAIIKDISPTTQIAEEIEQRNNALEVIQRKNRENFGPIFDQAITDYGTQALTGLEDLMTTYMGEEYVTDLRDTLGPAIKEEGDQTSAAKIEETGGTVTKTENTITMSHPEILNDEEGNTVEVTFDLDESGTVQSAKAGDMTFSQEEAQLIHNEFTNYVATGVISRDLNAPLPEDAVNVDPTSITREEWAGMSRSKRKDSGLPVSTLGGAGIKFATEEGFAQVELKRNANPDAMYKINISGLGTFKVKGEDLKYISDQRLAVEQGGVTISEFGVDEDMPSKTMTAKRLQKMYGEDAKEAVTVQGSEDEQESEGIMSPIKPKLRPDTRSIREKTMDRFGITQEALQEGLDSGQITELDLQVLTEEGEDIFEYMKDKVEGEPDDAELFGLLADWADENNKTLPFNKGFLVYQFKKVLSNG